MITIAQCCALLLSLCIALLAQTSPSTKSAIVGFVMMSSTSLRKQLVLIEFAVGSRKYTASKCRTPKTRKRAR